MRDGSTQKKKGVNAILMAVVPTLLCGNTGKNRCPFWSKE